MDVVAISAEKGWRWRIVGHAGEVVEQSREIFATIAAALVSGAGRRQGIDVAPTVVGLMVVATKIVVVDNQIEPALKALKKQMQKDGLFQEMKRRVAYDKPSVKRKRKQAAARKKRRKAMRRAEGDHD